MAINVENFSPKHKTLYSDTIDASGTNSSDAFTVHEFTEGAFQFVWDTMVGVATIELQVSLDGTNYDAITGSAKTTSGAAGSATVILDTHVPGGKIKAVITSAGTSGNIVAWAVLKEH